MSTATPVRGSRVSRALRSKRTRWILAAGIVVIVAWAVAYSVFTSEATASAEFATGTLRIHVNNEAEHQSAALSMANMEPGDEKYALLSIDNVGSIAFHYTMATATASADAGTSPSDATALANALRLGARVIGSGDACNQASYAAASANTALAEGQLSSATIASPGRGSIAPATSERLCFHVSFPDSGNQNALQGKKISATLTFTATPSPSS